MADTYLLIDSKDCAVNMIMWDGVEWQETHEGHNEAYQIPGGLRAIKYSGPWGPGWKWDGQTCIDPNPPPPPPPPQPAPVAPAAASPSQGIKTI